MINRNKAQKQADFCMELMRHLVADIKSAPDCSYYGLEKHTQKQSDVIRLRRELATLSKLLDPYGEDER